ncbi:MAG: hypothetical protein ACE5FN_02245 [Leptospirillia bacterium]
MSAVPATAMWVNLTAEQAKKAEKVGGFQASMGDPTKFMAAWSVKLEDGRGAALLMTEFLSVAFSAAEAARNFMALQPWEVQDAIARARGKLVFSVTTVSDKPGYADGLRGWVEAGGKKFQNTHWQNGAEESLESGGHAADSTFWFLADEIDPEGKVELVIRQEQTGETWTFPFDLSKIR